MPSSAPPHVVLLEDNSSDVFLLQYSFKEAGWLVRWTVLTNGEEGITYCQSVAEPIDFLILDYNLPCRSGPEVLTELRKRSEYCDTPAILFSSAAEHIIHQTEKEDRCWTCFFQKPRDLDGFLGIVGRFRHCWEQSILRKQSNDNGRTEPVATLADGR